MRNGNNSSVYSPISCPFTGSYPTYEEWKPTIERTMREMFGCSYPTYEEWKLNSFISIFAILSGSYPTYEEWKLERYNVTQIFKD